MSPVEIVRQVDEGLVEEVSALAERARATDGSRFLSDHLWLDLTAPGGDPVSAVARDGGALVGYAQGSRAHGGWVVEATVDPSHRSSDSGILAAVLEAIIGQLDTGSERVIWWTHDVSDAETGVAGELGFDPHHDLLQMRRGLPAERSSAVATRAFLPGGDEAAVLEVNNRAFADHDEQGGWTLDALRLRERQPWFQARGFRLHERDGRLAGFCWTKLHDAGDAHDAAIGEIYVIAVDPDFQGLGLGTELTLAGLDSIHRRGVTAAMLYVDAGNAAAVAIYQRLGFHTSRVDRAFAIKPQQR